VSIFIVVDCVGKSYWCAANRCAAVQAGRWDYDHTVYTHSIYFALAAVYITGLL